MIKKDELRYTFWNMLQDIFLRVSMTLLVLTMWTNSGLAPDWWVEGNIFRVDGMNLMEDLRDRFGRS